VTVYDRVKDEIRVQRPEQVCVVGHFYTFNDDEGRKRFELEHLLSECEAKGAVVLRKLVGGEAITEEERADFSLFMAFAALRTPDHVDTVKKMSAEMMKAVTKKLFFDVAQVKENLRRDPDAPKTEEELESLAQDMVEVAQSDEYEVTTDHQWAVSISVQTAFGIAPILNERNWSILHRRDKKKSFITSDAPVLLTTIAPRRDGFYGRGIGFANADALVLFPLDDSCVLAAHNQGGALVHARVGGDYMRQFNLDLASRCQRYIVGRDDALLLNLARTVRLPEEEWKPKFQMG
jgi:hypothetical protein